MFELGVLHRIVLLLLSNLNVHVSGETRVVEEAVRGRNKLRHESFHFRQSATGAEQRLKPVFEVGLLTRLSEQTFNHLVPSRLFVHGRVLLILIAVNWPFI